MRKNKDLVHIEVEESQAIILFAYVYRCIANSLEF